MAARPAKQDSIILGEIRLTYLPDGEGHFVPTALLPVSSGEGWRLHPGLLDGEGRLVTSLGGFLVETGDHKIVVDLGLGDVSVEIPGFATMTTGRLLDSLERTGGHCSVVLSSGPARAVILGDVMACPAQVSNAEWGVIFDVDPALARRTREQLLAELEGADTTVASCHFSGAVFGRVLPGEVARQWVAG